MDRPSPLVVIAAVVVLVGVAFVVVTMVIPGPPVEDSTYGYSVAVSTNATLQNVTVTVPLPTYANGSSPIADGVSSGEATVPDPWRAAVVETDQGLVLQLRADRVQPARQPEGMRYENFQFGLSVPAGHVIATDEPYGREPTIAPVDGRQERPCPNQARPDPRTTCYSFEKQVSASYDAPGNAAVDIILVHNGVNTYRAPNSPHAMYYERLHFRLEGAQDGWVPVVGFASTERPR